jgi:RNA-dependent RNA polymerase
VNQLEKPDIMRHGYNFSDGGGLISSELADRVADILKSKGRLNSQLKTNPCAYQLRFGGCKGVLVLYPGLLDGQT